MWNLQVTPVVLLFLALLPLMQGEVYYYPPRLTFYVQVRGKGKKQKLSSESTPPKELPKFTNEQVIAATNKAVTLKPPATASSPELSVKFSSKHPKNKAQTLRLSTVSKKFDDLVKSASKNVKATTEKIKATAEKVKAKSKEAISKLPDHPSTRKTTSFSGVPVKRREMGKEHGFSIFLKTKEDATKSTTKGAALSKPAVKGSPVQSSNTAKPANTSSSKPALFSGSSLSSTRLRHMIPKLDRMNSNDDDSYMIGWYILCFSCGLMFDTWF